MHIRCIDHSHCIYNDYNGVFALLNRFELHPLITIYQYCELMTVYGQPHISGALAPFESAFYVTIFSYFICLVCLYGGLCLIYKTTAH